MIRFLKLHKVLSAPVSPGSFKVFSIVLRLLLLFVFFVLANHPGMAQAEEGMLTGLRQGRIHVMAGDQGGQIKVGYRPTYGWSEPLLFFGPDGRLIDKTFPERQTTGQLVFNMDRGPGHYVLILKPSYLYEVSVTGGRMVYQPPVEQSGLKLSYDQQALYFVVPEGTGEFTLFWTNHRSYKGSPARLALYDPAGQQVEDRNAPKVDPKELMAKLTTQGVDLSEFGTSAGSGNFNPDTNPVPPLEVHVSSPAAGAWKVVVGSVNDAADDVGLWLDGVPSFFSSNPEQVWQPTNDTDTARAKVQVSQKVLAKPIIGAVGPFGTPGGQQEKVLTEYGVRGEKYFLLQPRIEPQNDNADPSQANPARFELADLANLVPRPGKFSLVAFDRWSDWMKSLPLKSQAQEWGEWVEVTASNLAEQQKMDLNMMAIQFLNEPNLKLELSQYLTLLEMTGTRLKNNGQTKSFPIAAPAVVTGLSKGDRDGLSFLDSRWIEESLEKCDNLIDMVVFNVYGASELEDTFLYPVLIENVSGIIKSVNSDGKIEPIIIGATNREGGLVSPRLFNEWPGGLWWASVLAQVANTGQVKVINYFNMIDKGIRQKGLFDAAGQPKHQALIEQLFTKVLEAGELVETISDHEGLEGITVRTGGGLKMILVNKSWLNINAAIQAPSGLKITQAIAYQGQQPHSYAFTAGQTTIGVKPETVLYLELN